MLTFALFRVWMGMNAMALMPAYSISELLYLVRYVPVLCLVSIEINNAKSVLCCYFEQRSNLSETIPLVQASVYGRRYESGGAAQVAVLLPVVMRLLGHRAHPCEFCSTNAIKWHFLSPHLCLTKTLPQINYCCLKSSATFEYIYNHLYNLIAWVHGLWRKGGHSSCL